MANYFCEVRNFCGVIELFREGAKKRLREGAAHAVGVVLAMAPKQSSIIVVTRINLLCSSAGMSGKACRSHQAAAEQEQRCRYRNGSATAGTAPLLDRGYPWHGPNGSRVLLTSISRPVARLWGGESHCLHRRTGVHRVVPLLCYNNTHGTAFTDSTFVAPLLV